ncbi:unnamed protein product [Eruca vesicaria subsp. sativa]|uniref:Uncharacterized protein n=1 Tax=Eruca vesicaria subsp. sativa TaxID=29727 RepID=A0ABC8KHD9_ERUVS|nr:unnamed protein product [Eruca vesicaria subsp. sativa]
MMASASQTLSNRNSLKRLLLWRTRTLSLLIGRPAILNKAEVRLLRFWEARNTNRNSSRSGELMSLNKLLIDENSNLMQASIAAAQHVRFRQSLTEGSFYSLAGFDITRSNPKYWLSDAALSVRFNDGTLFEKLTTAVRTISTELFRIR